MTDRDQFVEERSPRWKRLEQLLIGASKPDEWSELAALYRGVAADLARARSANLPRDIQAYLDELAGRAHNQLYGSRQAAGIGFVHLVGRDFPREVRAQAGFFWAAFLLFYLPFFIGLLGSLAEPTFAATVLPEAALEQMEQMYAEELSRGGTDDAGMAGFYVHNNVGIAFRCFATGALAGLGPVFFLVYNGLMIGTVLGHVTSAGNGYNLLTFVSGHTAWELTGIVVSGAAGLRLGWSMVVTGGQSRVASMRAAGPVLFRLMAGAAVMLLVAAAIEGFWSASPVPPPVKWVFGGVQVLIVSLWLLLGGRR